MATEALPPAARPELLTALLRKSGRLGPGRVCGVSILKSFPKLRSLTRQLRLEYEGPIEDAPLSVILKVGHLDGDDRLSYANGDEISFYRNVAPALPPRLVPHCFDVAEATDAASWHLLLEDLTDSHFIATEWPIPPTFEQCEQIVKALALFHATWWDDARLGAAIGTWRDTDSWGRLLKIIATQFDHFIHNFGELMPRERRGVYQRLLDQAPRLLARYYSRRNLTLIHGDAHSWNFFLPRSTGNDCVRLLDWEGWSIDTATDDLAYMMAMLWYPDRRKRIEGRLLDIYHAALLSYGVRGYDRRALQDDYRLSALWLITRPIGQAANKTAARVWWNNLERIFLAVDDLGCRELLD